MTGNAQSAVRAIRILTSTLVTIGFAPTERRRRENDGQIALQLVYLRQDEM